MQKKELYLDEGDRGAVSVCFVVEMFFNKEEELGKGRWPSHISNIIDEFTNKIILSYVEMRGDVVGGYLFCCREVF